MYKFVKFLSVFFATFGSVSFSHAAQTQRAARVDSSWVEQVLSLSNQFTPHFASNVVWWKQDKIPNSKLKVPLLTISIGNTTSTLPRDLAQLVYGVKHEPIIIPVTNILRDYADFFTPTSRPYRYNIEDHIRTLEHQGQGVIAFEIDGADLRDHPAVYNYAWLNLLSLYHTLQENSKISSAVIWIRITNLKLPENMPTSRLEKFLAVSGVPEALINRAGRDQILIEKNIIAQRCEGLFDNAL